MRVFYEMDKKLDEEKISPNPVEDVDMCGQPLLFF
jgi:hypothetical protein